LQLERADAGGGDPRQSHNWRCQGKHRPAPRLKECFTEVTLRDVAQRNFIIAREDEVVFNIMTRSPRRSLLFPLARLAAVITIVAWDSRIVHSDVR
jgi:hypothetical protein